MLELLTEIGVVLTPLHPMFPESYSLQRPGGYFSHIKKSPVTIRPAQGTYKMPRKPSHVQTMENKWLLQPSPPQ